MGLVILLTARTSLTNRYSFVPLFLIRRQGLDQADLLGWIILAANISSINFSITRCILGDCL